MRDPEFFDDTDFFSDSDGEEIADVQGSHRDIWQRLSQLMVACLFLLILAGILRIFWPEIERHRELSAEVHRLETIRDKRLERVAELQRQNDWILNDPGFVESIARDRLDMAHSDEVVVRIDRESEARALQIKRDQQRAERERRKLANDPASLNAGSEGEVASESPAVETPILVDPAADEAPRPRLRATVVDLSVEEEEEEEAR